MGTIVTASPEPWRKAYQQAAFKNVPFHVETGAKTSGRRIALHEYPKRDLPYAEDMGRRTRQFDIIGYLIEWDRGLGRDYRVIRDRLISALEDERPGDLILPTSPLPPLKVVCERYSITETRDKGGFCVFDMRFIEYGEPANKIVFQNTAAAVNSAAQSMNAQEGVAFLDAWQAYQRSLGNIA
jgi:prophage DNA circulation protein